jgi:hypothetical protein
MTEISVRPVEMRDGHFPKWTRIVVVTLALAALIALSFGLGRVTMGHAGHSPSVVGPAVVQPVNAPAGHAPAQCHLHGPC